MTTSTAPGPLRRWLARPGRSGAPRAVAVVPLETVEPELDGTWRATCACGAVRAGHDVDDLAGWLELHRCSLRQG